MQVVPQKGEARLLAKSRTGDEDAFTLLQLVLDSRIRRFVIRLIGSHSQEDDIVQDVFIALYQNLYKLDTVEKMMPFLYRVTRNRCYDILRQQGRYETISIESQSQALTTAAHKQPAEQTDWVLLYAEVQRAIEQLPELQRQTLILYAEEEFSYVEVAEAMGTQIGTVKSRLHHAKKTLRRLVSPEVLDALGMTNPKEA